MKPLLKEIDAAKSLGVCQKTLVAEVKDGKLKYILMRGRRFYDPADLEDYINRNRKSWPSENGKAHHTGNTTLPRGVVDFAEARGRRRGGKPSDKSAA